MWTARRWTSGQRRSEQLRRSRLPVTEFHQTPVRVMDQVAHTNVVMPIAAAVLITTGHQQIRQHPRDQATAKRLDDASRELENVRDIQRQAVARQIVFLANLGTSTMTGTGCSHS